MEVTAQKREILGKRLKALRRQGFVPAEFCGREAENLHLSVSVKEFNKIFKEAGESAIIKLSVDGKKINALIHDVQKNPITDAISHIDFYGIKMDEKIRVSIPLLFGGESLAIKEGGVLIKAIHELEIEALPADLPHHIEVDLGKLVAIGDSILVKDLDVDKNLPAGRQGVKVMINAETVIATIVEQKAEEEVAPVVSVEDVKVETEEKKEARAEAKVIKEKE
ncbi:50S ribosomal protein L25 [Candidatus Peregrinibacteria bacterium]|nr:50S ribosomal protein L25 [Candidatus Peregrinibacteria bacterium]